MGACLGVLCLVGSHLYHGWRGRPTDSSSMGKHGGENNGLALVGVSAAGGGVLGIGGADIACICSQAHGMDR